MCAEPIFINEDGTINEVPVTSTGMGEPYREGEPLYGYQACQVKNAYIDDDRLVIEKGMSEVMFRYVDRNIKVSSVTFDGSGEAELTFKESDNGELTLYIKARKKNRNK